MCDGEARIQQAKSVAGADGDTRATVVAERVIDDEARRVDGGG
jgi:hypothetical protein